MKIKRKCSNCNSSEHMTRCVDKQYDVWDVRHRVCYKCHPELDAGALLNGPEGGMPIMKDSHRDAGWIYCEPLAKDTAEESEKYVDDETVVNAEEVVNA